MKTVSKKATSPKPKHKEAKIPLKAKRLTKTGKAYGFLKDEIIINHNCFE